MAAPGTAALPGTLWHSFRDLSNPEGTFALNPNSGQSLAVSSEKWGVPWPDGSRFIQRSYTSQGSTGDATRLVVRKTRDGAVLTDQLVDGYVADNVRPSPQGTHQILALWGASILGPRSAVVYDLDSQKLLYATPPSKRPDALSWLPDGSLLRVQAHGDISRVVLGGAERHLARVQWPEARLPEAVYVSPDGTRALVQLAALRDTGSVAGVDLWMMNIDGTSLRRFTKNDLIASAFWSPDGKYVAFTKDTGVSCTASTCRGSCTVWYADASASEVVAVAPSGDARSFPLRRPNGSMRSVGCPVAAWVR